MISITCGECGHTDAFWLFSVAIQMYRCPQCRATWRQRIVDRYSGQAPAEDMASAKVVVEHWREGEWQ